MASKDTYDWTKPVITEPVDYTGDGPDTSTAPIVLYSEPQLPEYIYIDSGVTSREDISGTERDLDERTLTVVATGSVLPLIYGKCRIGPKVGFPYISGDNLQFPAYWCEGNVESINLYLEDVLDNTIAVSTYDGTQTAVDSDLSNDIGYTDVHEGVAYSVISLAPSQNPLGIVAEIEGRKIYDPRRDPTSASYGGTGSQDVDDEATWEYSQNPSLILADFHQKYRGDAESIDWDAVATCADYNDEILVDDVPRSRIGIVIDRRTSYTKHFDTLKEYAQVFTYYDGDTLVMTPNKARSTVKVLNEWDVIQGSMNFELTDAADTPDQVIIKFTNVSTTPWSEDIAQTPPPAGGAKNPQIIPMSGWQSYESAYRYAVQRQNYFNLINFRGSFQTFDEGLNLVPGDVIELSHSRGLSSKKFTVLDVTAVTLSRYQVTVEEYQPIWSSTVETEPTYEDVDLPSPNDFSTVTATIQASLDEAGAAVEKLWADNQGNWHTVFEVTFDGGNWPHTSGFRYRVIRTSDSQVLDEATIEYLGPPNIEHSFVTPPTTQDEEWEIRIWAINSYGNLDTSTYAYTTVTGDGKTVPPLDIPIGSVKSIEYGQFVRLMWEASADTDLSGYEVARLDETSYDADIAAENDPFDNANLVVLINRIDSLVALLDAQPVGVQVYGVRAWDRAGNHSTGQWVKQTVTAENAGAIGTAELDHRVASLTNMSTHEVFGVGLRVYSDVGDTWTDRFGVVTNTWPVDTTEPWLHNFSSTVTHSVESEEWDTVNDRTGNWAFSFPSVKTIGGASLTYSTLLATAAAYPTFTTYGSQQVQAEARYFKGKVALSPGDADEAFAVLFPMDASYQGQILEDAVDVSILNQASATAFSWNQSFTDTPEFWFVLKGTTPVIVALDSVTNTGGLAKAWDLNGNDAAAEITVYGEGP